MTYFKTYNVKTLRSINVIIIYVINYICVSNKCPNLIGPVIETITLHLACIVNAFILKYYIYLEKSNKDYF